MSRYQESEGADSMRALEELCQMYWMPINRYIIYLGQTVDAANDLTQSFFEQMLSKRNVIWKARRHKGKLRTLLSLAVKRFVTDEVRRRTSIKRGGKVSFVTIELDEAYLDHAAEQHRPDQEFDRQWARTLLQKAYHDLASEFRLRGQGRFFVELRRFLSWNARPVPQKEVAQRLNITIGALRMSIHRMRRRYEKLLREEIAQTVGDEAAVDEELRHFTALFQSSPEPTIHPPATS
jgi:DNA-directed RNA polymerase specialized sigma24 family protein